MNPSENEEDLKVSDENSANNSSVMDSLESDFESEVLSKGAAERDEDDDEEQLRSGARKVWNDSCLPVESPQAQGSPGREASAEEEEGAEVLRGRGRRDRQ